MIVSNLDYENLEVPPEFWEGLPSPRGKRIFVKPNLICPNTAWDPDSTTRVEVVELVLRKLWDEGADSIVVGDCGFKNQWEETLRSTGYDRLAEKYEVEVIGLQEKENYHKFTLVRKEGYLSLFGAKISDYVLGCDFVVNVPKLKVHHMAMVTGAIKNMMGIMAQKGSMHPRADAVTLHKRLRDLYFITKDMVRFCVLDGVIGSEYAEQCGRGVPSGVLVSERDQWATDVTAAKLMDIPPDKVPFLRLIRDDFSAIEVPNEFVRYYERPLRWRNV